jgi:multicomponent Na+:H+ antiporter subunit D
VLIGADLAVLPVLVALTGALTIPIAALAAPRSSWPLAVLSALAAAAVAVTGLCAVTTHGALRYEVAGWAAPWGIELVLDPLSAFMATVVTGIAALVITATGPAITAALGRGAPAYHALTLLYLAGALGMILSGDLFNVFVFLEVASISSYALIACRGGRGLMAAFRYLLLGTVGASFYLLGVGFLYALTGTLNMADMAQHLPHEVGSRLFVGGVGFLLIGLGVKMGLFPFHGWLPDAYADAHPAAAALLAASGTKAAAYVLARVLFFVLPASSLPVGPIVAWLGAVAIVAGGVLAARQLDLGRLLAYSSVSQMGYIALGIGLGSTVAVAGAYLHVLNHALMKAALFLALVGTGRSPGRSPVASACVAIAALSMVGIPPAGGFFSKWYLLQGTLAVDQPALTAAVLAGSLLAAVYMYRFGVAVWSAPDDTPPASPLIVGALVVLALAIIGVGLVNAPLVTGILDPAAGAR